MLHFPENIIDENSAYVKNESGMNGYYPIGVGNFWHSGIHLPINSDALIKPLVSGKVIAYRINKYYKKMDLPQKLTKEKLNEKYCKHKSFYIKKDEIYCLNEKIPSCETKISLASNFILLEHFIQDDDKNSLVFYTLYTNIGSSSKDDAYQKDFITDGEIHVLNDKEKFLCALIGPAGYDRDERYIEVSCFMEKSLFSTKFNSKNKVFLSAENYEHFYSRVEKNNCEKSNFYFTNRSRYVVKDIKKSGNQIAKEIQIKGLAVYLPSDVEITTGDTLTIKEDAKIGLIVLNKTVVHRNESSNYNLLGSCIDSFFNSCKSGKKYTVIYKVGKQSQILIDCSSSKTVWIVDTDNQFSSEIDKEMIYNSNADIDYYEELPFAYSFVEQKIDSLENIKGLTENTCYDKNKKEYCEIDGLSDVYVVKQDFEEKCFKNASDWDAFFDNQEELEDDIFCDKLSLLKKIDKSSVIKNLFGTNRMISDDEMKNFFGPNDHSLEMKEVVKSLRRIECEHPLEFDKTKFGKIAEEYKKRKEWTMGTMSENAANALKAQTEIIDIWADGLCKIFKKNNFFFVHPVYFLRHLDKAGLLEFNPYEDLTIKPRFAKGADPNIVVSSNPGFAPAVLTDSDKVRFPIKKQFNGVDFFWAAVNYDYGVTEGYGANHTGIDLAGIEGTPIYALTDGIVIATTYQETINNTYKEKLHCYGRMMLILGNNNKLYLLGHLSKFKKKEGEKISIGDIVAEVGDTGYSNGAHLHLEVFVFSKCKSYEDILYCDEGENINNHVNNCLHKTDGGTGFGEENDLKWADAFDKTRGIERKHPLMH